jgi:hypothetical protein
MALPAILTMLCVAGVSFYVRFMVALCQECGISHRIFFWVRLHEPSNLYVITQAQTQNKPFARAA